MKWHKEMNYTKIFKIRLIRTKLRKISGNINGGRVEGWTISMNQERQPLHFALWLLLFIGGCYLCKT